VPPAKPNHNAVPILEVSIMAKYHSIKNPIPDAEVKLVDGEVRAMFPSHINVNPDIYAIDYVGESEWSGEIINGDLLFVDPNLTPSAGDFAAIYPKDEAGKPFVELLFFGLMPQPWPTEGKAIPVVSIRRPNEELRTIACDKVDKVHKIIAKYRPNAAEVKC
jgi:hypothetical protein